MNILALPSVLPNWPAFQTSAPSACWHLMNVTARYYLQGRGQFNVGRLLPHGRVLVEDVARNLGMSERTLARRLSDEGLNFTEIPQQLRRDLAIRYLDDRKLHVSK